MSSESARIVRARRFFEGDKATEILECRNHRVVGSARVNLIRQQTGDSSRCKVKGLSHFNVQEAEWADDDGPGVLATEFHGTLNSLYALDIFSSFFGAAAKTLEKHPFSGLAEVHPNNAATGKEAWKSFFLRHDQFSKLARRIETIGLGNLDDIYLSMIPSLSVVNKLPEGTAIVKLASQQAEQYEINLPHASAIVELARQPTRQADEHHLWTEAGGVYLWLLSIAKSYSTLNDFSIQTAAVVLEFLRQVSMALDMTNMAPPSSDMGDEAVRSLEELKKELQDEFFSWPKAHPTVAALLRLYEIQRREWECGIQLDEDQKSCEYPISFHLTELHQAAWNDSLDDASAYSAFRVDLAGNINAKDIFGWTPLQYASEHRHKVIGDFLAYGANPSPQDLFGWTPLHYACKSRPAHGDDCDNDSNNDGGDDGNSDGDADGNSDGDEDNNYESEDDEDDECDEDVDKVEDNDGNSNNNVDNENVRSSRNENEEDQDEDADNKVDSSNNDNIIDVYEIICTLIRKKADTTAQGRDGVAPIHCSAIGGSLKILKLLEESGANVNVLDASQRTPLLWAAFRGNQAVVEYLWEKSDTELRDSDGRTALHLAVLSGHIQTATWLVDRGEKREVQSVGIYSGKATSTIDEVDITKRQGVGIYGGKASSSTDGKEVEKRQSFGI
ncbi:Ankyrin repeat protein [Colletotrichum higginsianum IMI 349063]|uniref:Ankyrin repeat protein n=1 Tax=Colletotrichum higginsianum (strain IMI 349063) TaxID=759273 RepID=A0A1B7YGF6_COLHI|nr:Ankyrin repeat protein [Colletotrichum higginsianum IMI 349063]OBR11251.1 Ankyrin repeat protein [Colletotrichum higginsianum IMI 349063]